MPDNITPTEGEKTVVDDNTVDFVSKGKYNELQQENNRLQKLAVDLSEDRESLKSKVESFGDLTPDALKELQSQNQEFKQKAAGGDPEALNALWEEKEAGLRADFGKVQDKATTTIETLAAENHELKVTSKVMDEYSSNVNDDMRAFIKAQVAKSVDVDEHSSSFVVKSDKGEIRYQANDPSKKMTVEDLFAELEVRYPSAFKAKGINKGSVGAGQTVQGPVPSTFGNIDIERCKTDPGYLKQTIAGLPKGSVTAFYQKLGL